MGISWKGNEGGGGGNYITTIDKRKGHWGIHSFFSFCVCVWYSAGWEFST